MNVREVALRANEDALKLCEILLPAGKKVGSQWVVGDAYGAPGDSMCVELDGDKRGYWYDHGGSGNGDMLKLIEVNRGLKGSIASADVARQLLGIPVWRPGESVNPTAPPEYDPNSKAWKIKGTETWIKPVKSWAYRNAGGKILAYVSRLEWSDDGKKKKDVIPQRFDETDGKWHWKGYKKEEKRPLYGLEFMLKMNDGRPLLIVEGEKTADAARKLFPDTLTITWMGGANQVQKADWSPVDRWKGPIVIWPDNDDPGQNAAIFIDSRFQKARRVVLPKGFPDGWDLADTCPEGVSLRGLLDAALAPLPPIELSTSDAASLVNRPFVTLGMDESGYFFLNREEGFLLHYTTSMFTELGIFRIAPDSYWEAAGFYKPKSNAVDWTRAAKFLIAEARRRGAFDPTRVRGRGVYMDEDRVVAHLGDRLVVDGAAQDFVDFKSEYLYPKRPAIRGVDFTKKITAVDSSELIHLLEKCTWQEQRSAYLLAGFINCVFLCGALPWRPHFFLKGPSSAGKTWLVGHVLKPLLADFARIFMAVASSEAGIRQAMLIDSLGCILDEFDADKGDTADAMASIMGLARQSSSDTGGAGVKGTQDGVARYYNLKSCFLFVGTAPAMTMKADESRITSVELRKANPDENFNFAEIQRMAASTAGCRSWVEGYRARLLSLVPQALQAVDVFRAVASRVLSDTRAGDQTGTLLAGAWMGFNDAAPTVAQAESFMATMSWEDCVPTESDTDHQKCLRAFTAFRVDHEVHNHRSMETVGRLIEMGMDATNETAMNSRKALLQFGVRVEFDRVFVAKGHRGTTRIFENTPYANKWDTHLMRLPEAEAGRHELSMAKFRGVWLTRRSFL